MQIRFLPCLLSYVVVFLALRVLAMSACGGKGPNTSSDPQWAATLARVAASAAAATGYSANSIDLTASPAHVRVSISDPELVEADQIGAESAASAVEAAVETALSNHTELAAVQVISVAVVHPVPVGSLWQRHAQRTTRTEDVLEFRKGPNQRCSHRIT